MKKTFLKKHIKGFSLIELFIVLLIVSIFASSALNILGKKTSSEKNAETKKRLELIANAIRIYSANHSDKLPCPVVAKVDGENHKGVTLNNYGMYANLSGCESEAQYRMGFFDNEGKSVMSGLVPTATLAIPEEYQRDAWGNFISYIMYYPLKDNVKDNDTISNIKIINEQNGDNILSRTPIASEIGQTIRNCSTGSNFMVMDYNTKIPVCPVFVLISHGANGSYSWTGEREQPYRKIAGGWGETENIPATIVTGGGAFGNLDNIFADLPLSNDFDDIIVYKTKKFFSEDSLD
jgi:prepilin-type N-terminal cleavage/methylation domain-containing protein